MQKVYVVFGLVAAGITQGSYLQQVGVGGIPRQVNLPRFFCPLNSLDACQVPGTLLGADAMKPCSSGSASVSNAVVAPGDSLNMRWLNVNDPSVAGSSITVSIAPFALDPPLNSFTCISSCLNYTSAGTTTGTVTVPANVSDGMYTLLWLWKYGTHWYSSCADIQVKTTVVATSGGSSYQDLGCANIASDFCQKTYGPSSYCKSWTRDNCGRSFCLGGDLPLKSVCTVVATTTTPKPAATTTTTAPTTTAPATTVGTSPELVTP